MRVHWGTNAPVRLRTLFRRRAGSTPAEPESVALPVPRRRRRRRWPAILVVCGVVGVVWAGWRWQPQATFSERAGGAVATELTPPAPVDQWRIRLRGLDAGDGQQGWSVSEGRGAGGGFAIHWVPDLPGFQVWHGTDRTQGPVRPILLGAVRVGSSPGRLDLRRDGSRLEIRTGERVLLRVMSPLASASTAASAFSVRRAVRDDDFAATLHVLPARPADPLAGILERAVRNGAAGIGAAERWRQEVQRRPAAADGRPPEGDGVALAAQAARFRLWLTYAVVVAAVRDDAAERVQSEVADLVRVVAADRQAEGPGLLLALLPALAERAVARPSVATDPARLAARRIFWLEALRVAGREALARAVVSPDQERWIRLTLHAARALATGTGDPLPVAAPAWLAFRWVAVAGDDPGEDGPLPGESTPDPARVAAGLLMGSLGITPERAVALSAALAGVLAEDRDRLVAAQRAAERLPGLIQDPARQPLVDRARILSRLLLASHVGALALAERDGVVRRDAVILARALAGEDEAAVRRELPDDPLAIALFRLARHRAALAEGVAPPPIVPVEDRWASILDGGPDAPAQAMLADPDLLPAAQALCAALAAQECATGSASWALLPPWPDRTLMLALAMPVAAGGGALEPDLP